jgi:lysyl-tRNA synthetase class 2
MKTNKKHIARVIDVDSAKRKVIIVCGHDQHEVEWPQEMPIPGDVFETGFEPSFQILRKLAEGNPASPPMTGDALRWRKPDARGRTRMETLAKRHLIKRAVRDYLHQERFIEIDCPLLVKGSTPDVEIDSFRVGDRYLLTSTEYQIKRMEIGGFDRSYTLTQNFRLGDTGRYRNPEFTMLEWARVGETLADIETDMEQMVVQGHKILGGDGEKLIYQGRAIDIRTPFDRLSVTEAIDRATGFKLPDFSADSFAQAVKASSLNLHEADMNDAPFLFSMLMDHIQDGLGLARPVFIQDWPVFQTSSAKEHESGKYVERSELFIAGIELSDGFPSLTDAKRQRETFAIQNKRRREHGKEEIDIDQKYLAAMDEGFPSGAGMALGFDRLVMVLTDQPDLASVLAYNWDEL